MDTTSPEHVLNENLDPDQPVNSPQFTRLPTPSPLRPHFEDHVDVDVNLNYSTHRTNDASNTTDIPVGGAEGPVTLTSVSALLNRYVSRVDKLENDLNFTKKNLSNAVLTLIGRVKKLEGKLKQRKKQGVVYDSDEDSIKHLTTLT